jgi:hypothetical protein
MMMLRLEVVLRGCGKCWNLFLVVVLFCCCSGDSLSLSLSLDLSLFGIGAIEIKDILLKYVPLFTLICSLFIYLFNDFRLLFNLIGIYLWVFIYIRKYRIIRNIVRKICRLN